ncbi:MAG: TolC family protein [Candidatus Krumholzibacteria bacterium]|jgi:cobalt-zinc-cadmium efflux system outer membrane protein|nr:TolC family protein [Candidatus Krumholzibacteria bacterium]
MAKNPALLTILIMTLVAAAAAPAAGADSGTGSPAILTLDEAVARALAGNPLLRARSLEADAAEADAEQAGAFANPELSAGLENAWGDGPLSGTGGSETTLLLSREIITWGRRSRAEKLAVIGAGISRLELKALRRETISGTEALFIELLAAQRAAGTAQEMMDLSAELLRAVRERVESGKVAPIEEQKAAVLHSTSRVERDRAAGVLKVARIRLASMWGAEEAQFGEAAGDLEEIAPAAAPDPDDDLIAGNPGLSIAGMEVEGMRAALSLEKAMRMPDISISGGTRWFGETGERALVFGLSVPLPLFDRGGAAIRGARYRMERAVEERKATELALRTRILEEREEMNSAREGAVAFGSEVLPAALNAFETAREGYKEGKWGLLEVLDAHRTLIEVRKQHVEILVSYHKSLSRLGELTGRRLLWENAREDNGKGGRS